MKKFVPKTVGGKRLFMLAALLDDVARSKERSKKFNMGTWGEFRETALKAPKKAVRWATNTFQRFMSVPRVAVRDINICGTAACALGHATLVPALHRAGVRIVAGETDYVGYMAIVKGGKTVAMGDVQVTQQLFYVKPEVAGGTCIRLWTPNVDNRHNPKLVAATIRYEVERLEQIDGFTK